MTSHRSDRPAATHNDEEGKTVTLRRRARTRALTATNDEIMWEVRLGLARLQEVMDEGFRRMTSPVPTHEMSTVPVVTQKVDPAKESDTDSIGRHPVTEDELNGARAEWATKSTQAEEGVQG